MEQKTIRKTDLKIMSNQRNFNKIIVYSWITLLKKKYWNGIMLISLSKYSWYLDFKNYKQRKLKSDFHKACVCNIVETDG